MNLLSLASSPAFRCFMHIKQQKAGSGLGTRLTIIATDNVTVVIAYNFICLSNRATKKSVTLFWLPMQNGMIGQHKNGVAADAPLH